MNSIRKIVSLCLVVLMALHLVPAVAADEVKTAMPEGLYTIWDMEELDTDTNYSGLYSSAATLKGTEFGGGMGLAYQVVSTEWHPFFRIDMTPTNCDGATELWFWLDASGWNAEAMNLGIGIEDFFGNSCNVGAPGFGDVRFYYYDGSGVKQTQKLSSWGWLTALPAKYTGWVGISLTDFMAAVPDCGLRMSHVAALHLQVDGMRDHIPGDKLIIDDVSVNVKPGPAEGTEGIYKGWFTDKEPVTDYAYSMVVIGDTQNVNCYYPDQFHKIYDWIVANKEAKNIQYVMGLGDITDRSKTEEWERAYMEISKLDGVVGYSLCRGNHDNFYDFNATFKKGNYPNSFDGSYGTSLDDTYRTLQIGNVKYLVMTLGFGPSDAVLQWAGKVINAHPDHNVIITTHAYMEKDGTFLEKGETHAPTGYVGEGLNDGDVIWEKLASKYPNVVMVLCGHIPSDEIVTVQSKGDHGNTVTQMLIDPQDMDKMDPTGMVAIFYFSEDGSRVQVEYYSPIKEKYWKTANQFELELNVVDPDAKPIEVPDEPGQTPPPEVAAGTVVWDMEDLPENFDSVAFDYITELYGSSGIGYHAGNWAPSAVAGRGYEDSTALAWTTRNPVWGNSTYIDFSNMRNAVTDWTGATELMFYVDVTDIGRAVPIDIAMADNYLTKYAHRSGSSWYLWKDGQWVEQKVNSSGQMVIPGDFAGWVRMPFETLLIKPDFADVSRIAFSTEHELVEGSVYFDHFMINVESDQLLDDTQPTEPSVGATEPQPTEPQGGNPDGSSMDWIWIVVAVVVCGCAIAAALVIKKKRSAA